MKGIPLGYHFRLYTYGPFDGDVLNDLGTAESLGVVRSEMVVFASGNGYGYEFAPGEKRDAVKSEIADRLGKYQSEIRWALEEFGMEAAADLELISTIIYADREAAGEQRKPSFQELGRKVKEIKARFPDEFIARKIRDSRYGREGTADCCGQE